MKTKLVIFGITGDLAQRKLLPALREIVKTDEFNDLEIVGVSRRAITPAELLGDENDPLFLCTSVFTMDLADAKAYVRLKEHLNLGPEDQALLYLSVPPSATYQIIELLGEAKLTPPQVKLLLEKPFGMDYTSAVEMNNRLGEFFSEGQIYRIDHYLAKEMAQNIVAFRQHNALFSHIWNGKSVEKIEVVASETLAIEGRSEFYEQTGALRDVLQGHLMQLLALVLMEMPKEFSWQDVPARRQAALEKLLPADPAQACRAQYKGYGEAVGNPGSTTETFAFARLFSADPVWKGVPLELTTGKALNEKKTEIRIHFRKSHETQGNMLVLRIQPDEAVEMEFLAKKPGYARVLEPHKMSFTYPEETVLGDAYEQVLVDAIRSHKSVFAASGEILASWKALQPLLDSWAMASETPAEYEAGTNTHTICRV